MSAGSLVILLVNVVCVVVQEGAVVAAPLDIVEVLVMVEGDVIFLNIYIYIFVYTFCSLYIVKYYFMDGAEMNCESIYFFATGATVPVGGHRGVAVCHLVGAAIAGRHPIVDERRCHMPTGGISRTFFFHFNLFLKL